MKININDNVKVKLTPKGKEIIRQHDAELQLQFPHMTWNSIPQEDKDGWSRWQLHELMRMFGENLYNGCVIPFETEIEVGK